MNCKNCGEPVTGPFCSQCGQNTQVGRISLATIVQELSEGVFQVNKGFFYTVMVLFMQPGKAISSYLHGKRKQFFKPISYVLLLSTVYFIVSQFVGQNTWMGDLMTGYTQGALDKGDVAEVPDLILWFTKNYPYAALLFIPVFSLASYWSYRRFQLNYIEHIVFNSFLTGQQAIIYAVCSLPLAFTEQTIFEIFPFVLAVLYAFWVFGQFFDKQSPLGKVLRFVLVYFLYAIFCTIIFSILMTIGQYWE